MKRLIFLCVVVCLGCSSEQMVEQMKRDHQLMMEELMRQQEAEQAYYEKSMAEWNRTTDDSMREALANYEQTMRDVGLGEYLDLHAEQDSGTHRAMWTLEMDENYPGFK